MLLPNRIFFTGVPGSKWCAIAQTLESLPGMNITDRADHRRYEHPQFVSHFGVYYGNGMEFEATLNPDYLDSAWESPKAGCKLTKSHDWAYCLDDIKDKFPDDWIMLVYRPTINSLEWWLEAGGFDITYPSYAAYQNVKNMRHEIERQNAAILEFAEKHRLQWDHFGNRWAEEHFNTTQSFDTYSRDILVTILK